VRFALSGEQREFGAAVRDVLAGGGSLAELGVPGLLVPESHGGLGGDEIDLLAVLEEAGRAAAPEPIVESAVAARLLTGDLADEWLPRMASGEVLVVAAPGPYVPHADRAALVLVERDGAWYTGRPGEPVPSVDPARRLCAVSPAGPVAGGSDACDRGAALTAAYLIGVAQRLLEMTVTYAGQRVQYGRPIGSYQALKHQIADVLVDVEFARPTAYRAAYSLAGGAPTRARDASAAKVLASDAARHAARVALQVHGAIGYTLEYDLHRWLRRAWSLSAAWGDAAHHRRRVADSVIG
jgi:alkylation response protein AidB-like acyl-CoA dehydrogenase